MGQRTQILLINDLIDEGKITRASNLYHCQWGYGRPLVLDAASLIAGCATGKTTSWLRLLPYTDKPDKSAPFAPLHHNSFVEHEIMNLTKKETKLNMDKVKEYIGQQDNNNGAFVLHTVQQYCDFEITKSSYHYGFLAGDEEDAHAFTKESRVLDALEYLMLFMPNRLSVCKQDKVKEIMKEYVALPCKIFNAAVELANAKLIEE